MFNYIEYYRNSRIPLDERERGVYRYLNDLRIAFNRLNRNQGIIATVREYREERRQFTGAGCCSSRSVYDPNTRISTARMNEQAELEFNIQIGLRYENLQQARLLAYSNEPEINTIRSLFENTLNEWRNLFRANYYNWTFPERNIHTDKDIDNFKIVRLRIYYKRLIREDD
jgi:hypothetical protein